MHGMSDQTLTFENAHTLSELYAADDALLREAEKILSVKDLFNPKDPW